MLNRVQVQVDQLQLVALRHARELLVGECLQLTQVHGQIQACYNPKKNYIIEWFCPGCRRTRVAPATKVG
jgi:hypothetical protein